LIAVLQRGPLRALLIATVAAALWLIAAGTAAADGSYLYMRGDQTGDYVVGANTHWYTNGIRSSRPVDWVASTGADLHDVDGLVFSRS
jgi:hypothetical protein